VVDLVLDCAEAFLTLRSGEWRIAELAGGSRRIAERVAGPRPAGRVARPEGDAPRLGRAGRALVVGAPLGWLDRRQAAALVATGAPLVVTPWKSIVVADPPEGADDHLRETGLLLDPEDRMAGVTACTGRPGCAKALADVRADAAPVAGSTLPVHWSGCERRCGRPRGRAIDVVATRDGYTTTVGDR
jgi:precorrin-3B synthase